MKDEDTTIHMNNHFQTFGQVGGTWVQKYERTKVESYNSTKVFQQSMKQAGISSKPNQHGDSIHKITKKITQNKRPSTFQLSSGSSEINFLEPSQARP